MPALQVITRGFKETEAWLRRKREEVEHGQLAAGRAAANVLKVMMKAEAPFSASSRDVVRKRAKVRHLRSTIRVRHVAGAGWAVGPASPLAHLVVRGARRGQIERLGGSGGAAHQMTLAGRRQLRMHARHQVGPAGAAQALLISSGGNTFFRASARPGPMPANDFILRTKEMAQGAAKHAAGDVLFRHAQDPNEGA